MKTILPILIFIACGRLGIAAESQCPVCDGTTVEVTTQNDDRSKPSKNLAVWNRSSCGNPFYGKGSFICPKDGYAYEASFKTWNLSLNDRDRFSYPLAKSVYSFPLPPVANIKSGVVYSQEFSSLSSVKHSLLFWCVTDTVYFGQVEAYAKSNGLSLSIEKERQKGQSIIKVTKQTEQVMAPNGP